MATELYESVLMPGKELSWQGDKEESSLAAPSVSGSSTQSPCLRMA